MELGRGGKMILIINTCKEKLHYFEFVKPVEDILKKQGIDFWTKHYLKISEKDLRRAKKIIICGTSLQDNQFMEDISYFSWLKNFKKPVLGICAGMQIIGLVFGGKIKKKVEIGFFREKFEREFLGLNGEQEVYHLHNHFVDFFKLKGFEIFSGKEVPQAIRFQKIYGILFHPEVRNKELVLNFVKNG